MTAINPIANLSATNAAPSISNPVAYNPYANPPSLDEFNPSTPKVDDPQSVSRPNNTSSELVRGSNFTATKVRGNFSFTWDFGKDKGGKQRGTFLGAQYDVKLGASIPGLPGKYKDHACIIDKDTGDVEIYQSSNKYTMFNPATGQETTADTPTFVPENVTVLQGGRRVNIEI
jgi:hypothetical protein